MSTWTTRSAASSCRPFLFACLVACVVTPCAWRSRSSASTTPCPILSGGHEQPGVNGGAKRPARPAPRRPVATQPAPRRPRPATPTGTPPSPRRPARTASPSSRVRRRASPRSPRPGPQRPPSPRATPPCTPTPSSPHRPPIAAAGQGRLPRSRAQLRGVVRAEVAPTVGRRVRLAQAHAAGPPARTDRPVAEQLRQAAAISAAGSPHTAEEAPRLTNGDADAWHGLGRGGRRVAIGSNRRRRLSLGPDQQFTRRRMPRLEGAERLDPAAARLRGGCLPAGWAQQARFCAAVLAAAGAWMVGVWHGG